MLPDPRVEEKKTALHISAEFIGNFLNVVQVIAECRGLRVRCDRLEEIDLQREQSEQGTNKRCLENKS